MNETQFSVEQIRKGIGLYIVSLIAASVFGFIGDLSDGVSYISSMAGGKAPSISFGDIVLTLIEMAAWAAVVYGLLLYRKGLDKFSLQLDADGAASAKKLSSAALLMIIGAAIDIICAIPGAGLLFGVPAFIISVIAFIFNLQGFSSLSKSSSLNQLGVAGAKKLYTGFILMIVGVIVGFIPFIGDFFELILTVLYVIFILQGWGMIQKSFSAEA